MLKQRWQGFHQPPAAIGIPATEIQQGFHQPPAATDIPATAQHDAPAPSMAGQCAVGLQEGISHPNSSTMQQQHWHNGGVPTAGAHPGAEASLLGRQARAGLQGHAAIAGDGSAPVQSPLSAYSPVLGTPVEYFTAAAAAPTVDVLPRSGEGRGVALRFAQHAFLSPNQDLLGNRCVSRSSCMLLHKTYACPPYQVWHAMDVNLFRMSDVMRRRAGVRHVQTNGHVMQWHIPAHPEQHQHQELVGPFRGEGECRRCVAL